MKFDCASSRILEPQALSRFRWIGTTNRGWIHHAANLYLTMPLRDGRPAASLAFFIAQLPASVSFTVLSEPDPVHFGSLGKEFFGDSLLCRCSQSEAGRSLSPSAVPKIVPRMCPY